MPYRVVTDRVEAPASPGAFRYELELWPHQSLTGSGFALVIAGTYAMLCVPLFGLLGTAVLWGVLPFALVALGGLTFAMRRSWRDRDVVETFRLTADEAHLTRRQPDGSALDWHANVHWVRVERHEKVGRIEDYLTLLGGPRIVEIGAFLMPEERRDLERLLDLALGRLRGAEN